jgi:HD-GYP domain-containing protein (c-di-GMP phosphodiesterase class II)
MKKTDSTHSEVAMDSFLILRQLISKAISYTRIIWNYLHTIFDSITFRFPIKTLRFKVSLFVFILLVATTLISCLATVRIMKQYILGEVIKRAESLSKNIAVSAGYSFGSKDILGLDNMVFKIKDSNADVEYIAIVNSDMKIIVHSDIKKDGEISKISEGRVWSKNLDGTIVKEIPLHSGNIFEVSSPIIFMGKKLGTVLLGVNKSVLVHAQHKAINGILTFFAFIILIGLIGSIIISSRITKPIEELSTGVNELKEGKKSRPLKVYSGDELGKLMENFNEMTALITEQREKIDKYASDLEESYVSTIKVLAAAIDARDPYTHGHSARVSHLSLNIGTAIGLRKKELEDLEAACLFHDVGKIKIPDSILRKTSTLNRSEVKEMMQHVEYGTEILGKAPCLYKYIPAVRHHHEWYNGEGYPDRLREDNIPLFASIICIADAFDAMTSDRPYRYALSETEAIRELIDLSGKQFNPHLIEVFMRIKAKNIVSAQSYHVKQ